MDSPTEISPSTKLLLAEIRRLFDEQAAKWDRRFAGRDAARDRQLVSRGGSVSTPAAASKEVVAADNWGSLFDGDDASDGADLLTPTTASSTVILADNWGGLFEQPTRVVEDHVPDISGLDTAPAYSFASAMTAPVPPAATSVKSWSREFFEPEIAQDAKRSGALVACVEQERCAAILHTEALGASGCIYFGSSHVALGAADACAFVVAGDARNFLPDAEAVEHGDLGQLPCDGVNADAGGREVESKPPDPTSPSTAPSPAMERSHLDSDVIVRALFLDVTTSKLLLTRCSTHCPRRAMTVFTASTSHSTAAWVSSNNYEVSVHIIVVGNLLEAELGGIQPMPPWPPPKIRRNWFQLNVSFILGCSLCQPTGPFSCCASCPEYWKLVLVEASTVPLFSALHVKNDQQQQQDYLSMLALQHHQQGNMQGLWFGFYLPGLNLDFAHTHLNLACVSLIAFQKLCGQYQQFRTELVLCDQPEEAILLTVNKVSGLGHGLQLDALELNLLYLNRYNTEVPNSYEHLLQDVLDGDIHLFMCSDKLAAACHERTPMFHEIDQNIIAPVALGILLLDPAIMSASIFGMLKIVNHRGCCDNGVHGVHMMAAYQPWSPYILVIYWISGATMTYQYISQDISKHMARVCALGWYVDTSIKMAGSLCQALQIVPQQYHIEAMSAIPLCPQIKCVFADLVAPWKYMMIPVRVSLIPMVHSISLSLQINGLEGNQTCFGGLIEEMRLVSYMVHFLSIIRDLAGMLVLDGLASFVCILDLCRCYLLFCNICQFQKTHQLISLDAFINIHMLGVSVVLNLECCRKDKRHPVNFLDHVEFQFNFEIEKMVGTGTCVCLTTIESLSCNQLALVGLIYEEYGSGNDQRSGGIVVMFVPLSIFAQVLFHHGTASEVFAPVSVKFSALLFTKTVPLVWDPGGIEQLGNSRRPKRNARLSSPSAWGQAETKGGGNVRIWPWAQWASRQMDSPRPKQENGGLYLSGSSSNSWGIKYSKHQSDASC